MDKRQAQELVSNTLQNDFDKDRFIYFVKNLLNHIDESKIFHARGYVKEKFKKTAPIVKTYERIGTYTDPEGKKVDVLIVYLEKNNSLDRARTTLRNFVADYLKQRDQKDVGLVAFVSPDTEDWRFSFVKMDYKIDSTNGKVEEEFTPARRYSFLVGKHENSHTAQSCLLPLLLNDEVNPTLKELEDVFSVEKVTKEFFEKYHGLFLKLKKFLDEVIKIDEKVKADFKTNNINPVDFAKKLLGQIVFLYFLQKKGWFGVKRDEDWGTGPKNFLRELFDEKHGKYTNFFNDIMEPLFYQALRNDRRHDDDYYDKLKCKIPFLNGGLFDPINNYDWVHTDILLPNELFSNSEKTKEGDTGNGILDIFDRYNFTVKEDEPLEKEVAVDPEMLGKVFENLLEVKDRKSKGTYYTPREIVHYMCQQSLINYLYSELNPEAIIYERLGEKQFDMLGNKAKKGQLDLTVEHRSNPEIPKEDIEILIQHGESVAENEATVGTTKSYSYKLSKSIRQNAKLIDEKLANIKICDPAIGSGAFPVGMMAEIVKARNVLSSYIKDKNRSIYNFKRECIEKSLYGVDIDPGAVEIAKLRLWLSLVVDEDDIKQIKPLPNLDYKIVCGNSLLGVEKNLFNQPLFNQLEKLKPLLFNETDPTKKQEYKEQIDKLIIQITNGRKEFDFEIYFSEVFHEKKGFDVVIANPPYGADIPKDEINNIKLKLKDTNNLNSAAIFIDFGKNYLTNTNGILSFIVPKSLLYSERWFSLVESMLGNVPILVDVEKAFENVKLEQVVFLYGHIVKTNAYLARKFLNNEFVSSTVISNDIPLEIKAWICDVSKFELSIFKKLRNRSLIPLGSISETKRGVGLQKFLKNKGNYPVIGGINISRYGCSGIKGYLAKEDFENQKQRVAFMRQPKIISQDLVAHIQNPNPHILIASWLDLSGKTFGLDTVQNTIINDNNYDIRYILGLLNSKFISWYTYKFIYCCAIRTMHFDNYYIGKILIPDISLKDQKPFVEIVDNILVITKSADYLQNEAKQKKVKEYECQIDEMVYKLYGLTPEEIKVVEGN